jgi:hypothetical protein
MKKLLVIALSLLATTQVLADGKICSGSGGTAGGVTITGTQANYNVTSAMFVVRSFPVRCSANVSATTAETAVAFGVGALSIKGKSYFQGNTGGGAITAQACGVTCTDGTEATNLIATVNAAT